MTRLPTFVCIGAQKAGTTTLYDILRQHPSIYLPVTKETKFFCDDEVFERGPECYARFFADARDDSVVGEIDPDCLFHPEAASRMRDVLGTGLRLIVLLRNPADRAYSHYLMSRSRGFETDPFEDALEREEGRMGRGAFEREHFSYAARGRYTEQIRRFLDVFAREQMEFVLFESEFVRERDATIRRLLAFVGAEDLPLPTNVRSNPSSEPRFRWVQDLFYRPSPARDLVRSAVGSPAWKTRLRVLVEGWNRRLPAQPHLTEEIRTRVMQRYFAADVSRLEEMLGRSLDVWRTSARPR